MARTERTDGGVLTPVAPDLAPPESTYSDIADLEAVTLERVEVTMRLFREIVRCSAFVLSAWDPTEGTHRHRKLFSDGYSDDTVAHLNDGFVKHNPAFQVAHTKTSGALRWRDFFSDFDLDFSRTYTAEEVLLPAGFNEGTTICLRLPGGRYAGALSVSWSTPAEATSELRQRIEQFAPLLAITADVLDGPRAVAAAYDPAACVAVASSAGFVAVPGRAAGPHLREGTDLWRSVRRRLPVSTTQRFLWIGPDGGWHRVELTPCRGGTTLVAELPVLPPYRLSVRELEVLQLVTAGLSNPKIAAVLSVSATTVSTYVERILFKLQCTSRVQLASKAVEERLLLLDPPAAAAR